MSKQKNKKYSVELKLQEAQDYLNGGGSLRELCKKYGIKHNRQLMNWIMWYNSHKEFKERRGARTEIYTMGKDARIMKKSLSHNVGQTKI